MIEKMEHNTAARTLTLQPYESPAAVWFEILRTSSRNIWRNPLKFAVHWLKLHWKPLVLSAAFWLIYMVYVSQCG